MLKIKLITPPAVEPITKDQVKTYLRFDLSDTDPDNDIDALIPVARQWCEKEQNMAYITQTWERVLDAWPDRGADDPVWTTPGHIKLPRPPLQSVTSFTYTDAEGTPVTWASSNYIVDSTSEPGRIVPVSCWPNIKLRRVNGITIRYIAGFGDDANDVPAIIQQAIIILVGYWYEHGICDPPPAVYSLLGLDGVIPI